MFPTDSDTYTSAVIPYHLLYILFLVGCVQVCNFDRVGVRNHSPLATGTPKSIVKVSATCDEIQEIMY